jgi:hypothetical protein
MAHSHIVRYAPAVTAGDFGSVKTRDIYLYTRFDTVDRPQRRPGMGPGGSSWPAGDQGGSVKTRDIYLYTRFDTGVRWTAVPGGRR